jgi:hypothetical protein
LLEHLRSCFTRTQTWQHAGRYVSALVSDIPKRNGWTIAQRAGDRTPDRTPRLLNRAVWDTPAAMSGLHRFVMARLDTVTAPCGRLPGPGSELPDRPRLIGAGPPGRAKPIEVSIVRNGSLRRARRRVSGAPSEKVAPDDRQIDQPTLIPRMHPSRPGRALRTGLLIAADCGVKYNTIVGFGDFADRQAVKMRH